MKESITKAFYIATGCVGAFNIGAAAVENPVKTLVVLGSSLMVVGSLGAACADQLQTRVTFRSTGRDRS